MSDTVRLLPRPGTATAGDAGPRAVPHGSQARPGPAAGHTALGRRQHLAALEGTSRGQQRTSAEPCVRVCRALAWEGGRVPGLQAATVGPRARVSRRVGGTPRPHGAGRGGGPQEQAEGTVAAPGPARGVVKALGGGVGAASSPAPGEAWARKGLCGKRRVPVTPGGADPASHPVPRKCVYVVCLLLLENTVKL